MIISHKYKFIFIHIPKTAGSFVTKLLLNLDKDAIDLFNNKNGHQTFKEIKDLEFYDSIRNYTFFTIIRNPIDQVISWYNHSYYLYKYNNIFDILDNNYFYYMTIYRYCIEGHDSNNDPEIIKIPHDKLKEKLTELFKKLDIDTSVIDLDVCFKNKINESRQMINKKMFEQDIEFKNKLMNNKVIMDELYYYNLFS